MATKRKQKTMGRPAELKDRVGFNVYLAGSQKRKLERMAKREGVSMGTLVRAAIDVVVG